ncbi:hypothetical protein DICVIV_04012 [Dictyocaulus viviparus]|uniref:Uncharacterized protein n=1 Tax=Dictyocaulus viviparus TaxID=29172 RepID=A0A0D8XYW5_DICVI|nr:hypothetical protein DICVIV_04012 [Dictyocaulus viviparus]
MNLHVLRFAAVTRFIDLMNWFKCRRSYCLLSVGNYTSGLIIVTWLISDYGDVLDALYCISSCLFGIAITGLYLYRPLFMLPDIIYKAAVSFCALFYSIQETDATGQKAVSHLILVMLAVGLLFIENYLLLQLWSSKQLESQRLAQRRPPPPTYDQLSTLELCHQTGSCPMPDVKYSDDVNRPETPPPCYELAVAVLRLSLQPRRLSL